MSNTYIEQACNVFLHPNKLKKVSSHLKSMVDDTMFNKTDTLIYVKKQVFDMMPTSTQKE